MWLVKPSRICTELWERLHGRRLKLGDEECIFCELIIGRLPKSDLATQGHTSNPQRRCLCDRLLATTGVTAVIDFALLDLPLLTLDVGFGVLCLGGRQMVGLDLEVLLLFPV